MNKLQIVQRLRQEAGVSGSGPTTTASQAGELKRLVDWADDAWLEIQGLTLWNWRWSQPSLTLPEGASSIVGTRAARLYDKDSMRRTADGGRLDYMPWRDFAEQFPATPVGGPSVWTVAPDRSIRFNGVGPAGDLALKVEAYAAPAALELDDDVPSMPAEYHMAIVWLALQKYAAYEEAGVLYQTAEREYGRIRRLMELDETPDVELGGALC